MHTYLQEVLETEASDWEGKRGNTSYQPLMGHSLPYHGLTFVYQTAMLPFSEMAHVGKSISILMPECSEESQATLTHFMEPLANALSQVLHIHSLPSLPIWLRLALNTFFSKSELALLLLALLQ